MLQVDTRLVEAARKIGPVLAEHSTHGESHRRLAQPVVEALRSNGFQRLLAPASLGGLEVDPVTCARVVEELAIFDSAAAWSLQIGNTSVWWSARMPQAGIEEIYGSGPGRDVPVAAAFHPPQHAVEVKGGFRLSGRSPLASNVHDAEWVMLTGMIFEGDRPRIVDGRPDVRAFTFAARDAEIVDTWDSLGMRGSDSHDVAVQDLFVPSSRTFSLGPEFQPGPHFQGPLYRFPGMAQVGLIIAPVLLAMGRGAIDELRALAASKTPFGSTKSMRDRVHVQATLARAEGILRSAWQLYYETLSAAWDKTRAGQRATLEERADLLLAGVHAAQSSAQVVEMMHALAGTSGVYKRNRLERHLRDAMTLRHHGFVSESRYEVVGQVYLGVEPEFPLVAF
jgi:alkylation response protein AidB-like acyl-CoA dehydrogenase